MDWGVELSKSQVYIVASACLHTKNLLKYLSFFCLLQKHTHTHTHTLSILHRGANHTQCRIFFFFTATAKCGKISHQLEIFVDFFIRQLFTHLRDDAKNLKLRILVLYLFLLHLHLFQVKMNINDIVARPDFFLTRSFFWGEGAQQVIFF